MVVHPNQGELISCDQAGRIKQWDLSENICTHELVRVHSAWFRRVVADAGWLCRPQLVTLRCVLSALRQMGPASLRGIIRRVNPWIMCGVTDGAELGRQGKCYVWKINDERSELPRFQAVTKFQAHNKYLTRCLLSPDVK